MATRVSRGRGAPAWPHAQGETQPAGRRPADRRGVVPRGARTVGVVLTAPRAPSAASGRGMDSRLLCRARPKLGRRSGASAGPESPTQRSALGQPGARDSARPASDPPPCAPHGVRPPAPGKHPATSRTTAPPQYLSHVPRLSVRMPLLAPDRSSLSPCAHADPPQPVWSRRLGSAPARLVCGCSPRPATRGAPWVLSPPRRLFPSAAGAGAPAACSAAPPAPARSGAPGPHKASSRALRCLLRVQCRTGFCRRGCCTGCPEEQDLSSGFQNMNGFLWLRLVLSCRFCFPGSDRSFSIVSSHENYSY